jgi:hypothetical protein
MTDDKTANAGLDPLAVARAVGLDQSVRLFADDIIAAAQAAAEERAYLPSIDGCAEPWPPMHVRSGQ